jgi:magnesium-transporting ATPase (P-type)
MGFNYERFRLTSKVKRIYTTTLPKKKMASIYKDERGKLFLFVKGTPKFLQSYCNFYINRY